MQLEEERTGLEKTLDVGYKFFVGQKHNDVIALFNTQVIIRDHYVIATDDSTDDRARR